jgi:gluconolactonase
MLTTNLQGATIIRLKPALDALVSKDAKVEKVAAGFGFIEGPLWRQDGHLWFSDLFENVVRSVTPDGKVNVLIRNAGGESSAPPGNYIGPNAMAAGEDGSVLLCQHTNRRIVRIRPDLSMEMYVDRFEGKRFNSPNDLVLKSDGALYFTDPPYGLLKQDDDAAKELPFNGVFRYAQGKLQAIIKDLPRPNGIAFSPDEKVLYVANSEKRRYWMRYDVAPDGSVSGGRIFVDVSSDENSGVPDGMKVDSQGNIYATGPGGVLVFSPAGDHLGTVRVPETPANCAWGDDGKTLYITATTSVYRLRTEVAGQMPVYPR